VAIKIKKKKPETAEVEADLIDEPDQVLAATQDTFGWLTANRNAVIGGVVALVVGLAGFSMLTEKSAASAADSAIPTLNAIGTAGASVGEDGIYANANARATALAAAADEAPDSALTAVLAGAAQLQLGDAAASSASFAAALEAFEGRPEGSILAFAAASAAAEAGDLDRALTLLDNVGGDNPELAPIASLQAAQLIDAYGEPADALAAYRQTIRDHDGVPGSGDVTNRIIQLEIELGVDPEVAEAEPAEGDEG
jgi:predicted negative regulator of RcsB-dependent stress response